MIVSDHRPLQWLKTFEDETGRLGRWSIMFANTNYTVKYRPGRIHENADFLSRIPVYSVMQSPANVVMIKEQEKDVLCSLINPSTRNTTSPTSRFETMEFVKTSKP